MRDRPGFVLGAYAAADLCISPSRFLRDKLLATGAFDPEAFLYSDNGMSTDHLAPARAAPEWRNGTRRGVRFGFIGSLVWYKGAEVLLRAMARLAETAAELVVHGDFRPEEDEHHARLAELARSSGASVRFAGRFDNARLAEVHAAIDVLVVPSLWFENSPITIHEASLTRTPVVVSDIGGMAEHVCDGERGLLFRVGDDADLARVMRRFLAEPG
ncbi:MAG: glycosyltransferase, partial [Proteobacteria bacterium]|nr:glycosyltransferase [Pseudomonadota bacterium]